MKIRFTNAQHCSLKDMQDIKRELARLVRVHRPTTGQVYIQPIEQWFAYDTAGPAVKCYYKPKRVECLN